MRVNPKHDPLARPLGCNGKYGASGRNAHHRREEKACYRCRKSANHYRREAHRGQKKPRTLKPCGTWAAAARHRSNNEPLDLACSVAEASYQQALRERRKEVESMECEHEFTDSQGVCQDCEQRVENWEPTDAEIFAHHGQTKEIQKAA